MRPSGAGLTLDAGALIAIDKGDPRGATLIEGLCGQPWSIAVPCTVVAQVWRGGPRQGRIAVFLRRSYVEIVVFDDDAARAVGLVCGETGVRDIVDVSVVVCARARPSSGDQRSPGSAPDRPWGAVGRRLTPRGRAGSYGAGGFSGV